jgi:transcriptional regulator with XRE-family HTH domain
MSTIKNDGDDFSLGKRLKIARKRSGMTQEQVVEILIISKNYVSRIEKDDRDPSPHVKNAIEKWINQKDEKYENNFEEEKTNQVSEPERTKGYKANKFHKYERLLYKFEYVFDFLIEWHGDDSREIDLFLERMKSDFLPKDPNYRQWTYNRDEKAKERQKNMVGEDNQDRIPDIESES